MAPVRASHAALPFLERQGGSIIHISSIAGFGASVRTPPYGAVKAALMEYTNYLTKLRESGDTPDATAWTEAMRSLTLMLGPSVPHIAEELWHRIGREYSVHTQQWPAYDASLAALDEVEIAVQVNGKLRDRVMLPTDSTEDVARHQALASERVRPHVEGKEIERVIYVPNRLLNIVVKP